MQRTYCDRCGRDISNEIPYKANVGVNQDTLEMPGEIVEFPFVLDREKNYDLCSTCKSELDEFMKSKEVKYVKKSEEPQ